MARWVIPGAVKSTMKAEMPLCLAALSVYA